MPAKQYDYIYEKLQEPIKVYLNKETKELLEHDCQSFGISTRNEFYNLLVSNYISEYVNHLEESGKRILSMMEDLIVARNKDELPAIARKIAWKDATALDSRERGEYISIRINTDNADTIAEMISSAIDNVKVSVFFRNLFLNYLSLPAYRREQIIIVSVMGDEVCYAFFFEITYLYSSLSVVSNDLKSTAACSGMPEYFPKIY